LLEPPESVEAFWLLPDDPPFRFIWRRRRHRVTCADGPERIAEEWWQPGASGEADAIRDYYGVEMRRGGASGCSGLVSMAATTSRAGSVGQSQVPS